MEYFHVLKSNLGLGVYEESLHIFEEPHLKPENCSWTIKIADVSTNQ